jgi:hypothetical protein
MKAQERCRPTRLRLYQTESSCARTTEQLPVTGASNPRTPLATYGCYGCRRIWRQCSPSGIVVLLARELLIWDHTIPYSGYLVQNSWLTAAGRFPKAEDDDDMRTPEQARALVVVVLCLELLRERLIRGLIPFGVYCSADLGMEPRPIEPTYLNSNARFETSAFADTLEWYPPQASA